MLALANTTVTVYRGTTTDVYGDEQDTNTALYTGIPASIIEQTRRTTTRDDPTPRVIRYAVGRVTSGTDITDQDRLYDEKTGAVYVVDSVSQMTSAAVAADVRLELRRTT